jgi:hypothetical protein
MIHQLFLKIGTLEARIVEEYIAHSRTLVQDFVQSVPLDHAVSV